MSDLQCPATVLVSRPGDAESTGLGVSDGGGSLTDSSLSDSSLTDSGREQVRDLVEEMKARRIAGVYCSILTAAVQSAELAASELGVEPVVVDGLQELSAGEDGDAVVSRFRDAIEGLADVHRGETVLVFTHGAVMSLVVPRLCANTRDDLVVQPILPSFFVPAEIDIDADGWRLLSWPGVTDRGSGAGGVSGASSATGAFPTSRAIM